jgi:hypothetical protein
MEGSKYSNFKIDGTILQNGENREIKTAIKPNKRMIKLTLCFPPKISS